MTVKMTLTGLDEDLVKIAGFREGAIRGALEEVKDYLLESSPIDTGAYIESHTIKSNNTRGRGRDSKRRERDSGWPESYNIAEAQLTQDIDNLNFESDTYVIRNDSPHAVFVEYGTANVPAYAIITNIAAIQFSGQVVTASGENYEKYYKGIV